MTHKRSLKFLISAGPTREPLDPVRFISNCSTGYLGYQMALAAKRQGHKAILVSGPVSLKKPLGVKTINVTTARQMLQALRKNIEWADCLIMTAAVSDFRPKKVHQNKIKKNGFKSNLELVKNPDILKCLKAHKKNKIYIGFALETENLRENAKTKLRDKGLDVIIANKEADKFSCFGKTNNTYYVIDNSFSCKVLKNKSKSYLARLIIDKSKKLWYNFNTRGKG
jgi:phosphopantothenoylcysteine decarboxylase/phosphopantothenate--cysteine ligase